jgi:hypothetical protein
MAESRTTGLPGLNLPLDYTPDTEVGILNWQLFLTLSFR